jgi:hypothetical protein
MFGTRAHPTSRNPLNLNISNIFYNKFFLFFFFLLSYVHFYYKMKEKNMGLII